MEAWSWILVYLVGFTLFQLLLFRYFTDDAAFEGTSLGTGDVSTPQSVDGGQPVREEPSESDRDGVFCRHCGAFNQSEQKFRYCRKCVKELR